MKSYLVVIGILVGVLCGSAPSTTSGRSSISIVPRMYEDNPRTNEQDALRYMRSPERIDQYESDFRKAGVLIAKALDAGKFGPVRRYNSDKQDRQHGYSGWGGIATPDSRFDAQVWWNPNGSISFSKMGVIGFKVTGKETALQIEQLDSGAGPYNVCLSQGEGVVRATSIYGGRIGVEDETYPQDLDALVALDEDAWAALDYTMALNFGTDWRQLR